MNKNLEIKLKKYFGDMLVYKSSGNTKFFSALSLPSFMRDWLVMRFSDEDGNIDTEEISDYVRSVIPKEEQWNKYMMNMLLHGEHSRFLTKVKIEFDTRNRRALFSLPDFSFPNKKEDAVADWNVVEQNQKYLMSSNEIWGIVELSCCEDSQTKKNIFRLVDFVPFCPYTIDINYYKEARKNFSVDEWIDILLGAIDYNPQGFETQNQKISMLKRLLPFVEKRLNLIELAPKETGKSYIFSNISKYGWLISGGSITRAKMFFDMNRKTTGLVSHYDYVAFDEIQSITFKKDALEMQGALKGYLESGEYRVGNDRKTGNAGLILLGNIDSYLMNENKNMFTDLPEIFRESALLDRFHGFIKGWSIPKMKENLKANDWALNSEYFSEIIHSLRDELNYRIVVDQMLDIPKNASTRDTEAIKRICTGFLKLLFPHVESTEQIDENDFEIYCLRPAKEMRGIIKTQLGILDFGEFGHSTIPDIKTRHL
ncbi:MAG: BREX system Lon protease-like protein BrxL [Selenomonadaceae bacterium]|nr:BREX system Lon protease-like protein BrxL [Selenomonadaceae bacterium]